MSVLMEPVERSIEKQFARSVYKVDTNCQCVCCQDVRRLVDHDMNPASGCMCHYKLQDQWCKCDSCQWQVRQRLLLRHSK